MTGDPEATVLLTLAGPMQSWGGPAWVAQQRPTGDHPTFSGVLGLVGSAMGATYDQPVEPLATLRYAVRGDRPGAVMTDWQTAGGGRFQPVPGDPAPVRRGGEPDWSRWVYGATKANDRGGVTVAPDPVVSRRYYLEDAVFTAALSGPVGLIEMIAAALTAPARPLFLGRRSCPPAGTVFAGLDRASGDPVAALTAAAPHRAADRHLMSLWLTAEPGDIAADLAFDVPTGRWADRTYGARWEKTQTITVPASGDRGPSETIEGWVE